MTVKVLATKTNYEARPRDVSDAKCIGTTNKTISNHILSFSLTLDMLVFVTDKKTT